MRGPEKSTCLQNMIVEQLLLRALAPATYKEMIEWFKELKKQDAQVRRRGCQRESQQKHEDSRQGNGYQQASTHTYCQGGLELYILCA